jgi:hypothetical protein
MPDPDHAAQPEAPASSKIDQIIDQWFVESFHGTVVSQNTQVFNVVLAAKDDLKKRLAGVA